MKNSKYFASIQDNSGIHNTVHLHVAPFRHDYGEHYPLPSTPMTEINENQYTSLIRLKNEYQSGKRKNEYLSGIDYPIAESKAIIG